VDRELIVRVRAVERPSRRTALIRIEIGRPFPFSAGQAVSIGLATQRARRPYSIASSPREARTSGVIAVLASVDDSGALGTHLHPLEPGSVLALRGPIGHFGLPPRLAQRSLLFVAGGTGVAPLRSMLWTALDRVPPPAIDFVFSARTPAELVFDSEFRRLRDDARIRYWPTVTRRAGTSWRGRRGRIDRELLANALQPSPVCLVCGSQSFIDDMTALLRSLGVRASNIRREEYYS